MGDRTLDFIALGVLIFVVLTIIYGVIYIHDIPYEIAKKRKHPHQDAIHTAGWVSLFLMHTIWPFLWIWASLYKPGYGWGFDNTADNESEPQQKKLLAHIEELERSVQMLKDNSKEVTVLRKKVAILEEQINNMGA